MGRTCPPPLPTWRRFHQAAPLQGSLARPPGELGAVVLFKVSASGGYIDTCAAVCLATVMSYIASEVIEVAGDVAKDTFKIHTLIPRLIMLGVRGDEELDALFSMLYFLIQE